MVTLLRCHPHGMSARAFAQVDVFTTVPYGGDPVAVVLDAEGLDTEVMQRFARWTNLSETTLVLPAEDPGADYRVRIFTPGGELPSAGHPTLGTCHAWLAAGGRPRTSAAVVQECVAGLVPVRRGAEGLAFAAPPLLRTGPLEPGLVEHVAAGLGIEASRVVDSQWVDNGPGWVAVLLADADAVLALSPGALDLVVGVTGPHPPESPEAFEVRAFFPAGGGAGEDPVTGSLNASLAQWLTSTGRAKTPFSTRQGTCLGRTGRVHLTTDQDGTLWTGGATTTRITGHVDI